MRLTNLPIHLPDETLYSLAARIRLLNGIRNDRDACSVMFGSDDGMRVGDAPVDLDRFCNVTGFHYGNALDVARLTTVFGFLNRLGYLNSLELNECGSLGRSDMCHAGLASLSNGEAHKWRWCPVCRSNELREYGAAYWHRVHQLQGVHVCTIHFRQLQEVVIPHRARQGHFFLPDNVLGSGKPTEAKCSEKAFNAQARLANLAAAALGDDTLSFDSRIFVETLLRALYERGLVSRSGNIRRELFCTEFRGYFYDLIGTDGYGGWLTDFALLRLARNVSDPGAQLDAAQRLMLIEWLWGSWALFRRQIEWQGIISYSEFRDRNMYEPQEENLKNARKSIRDQHRQACANYLALNPEASRTDFWNTNPKACRWLLSNDKAWLNNKLPLMCYPKRCQRELF